MTEVEAFVIADEALCDVVDRIASDQWGMALPEWFVTGGATGELDLRKIVNYHAFDDAWVPDVLAGRTAAEVGDRYAGDLLGADPKRSFRAISAKAVAAARALDDPAKTVHLSYGDFPAAQYLKHITSFRGFRSYDIAKLIGTDTTMPDGLIEALFQLVVPNVEEWRALGVYGPKIEPPPGASRQTELLCLVGREP
ncbi:MAG TPA: hypothetical protein VHA57_11755 [Actinomycetota bacterium]|nr:hypothetical protein [Actinomycetota bacterium]